MNYNWMMHYFRDFKQVSDYIELDVPEEGWYQNKNHDTFLVFKDNDYLTVICWKECNGRHFLQSLLDLPWHGKREEVIRCVE